MEWMRLLLFGKLGETGLGKSADLVEAEKAIKRLGASQWRVGMDQRDRDQRVVELEDELARQRLAIQALTRFLIKEGMIDPAKLDAFIREVDAEDGEIDGKLAFKPKKSPRKPGVKVQGKVFNKVAEPPKVRPRHRDEVKLLSRKKPIPGKNA